MRIEVTQEDIDEGQKHRDLRISRCCTCAVALAITRATGLEWKVSAMAATQGDDCRIKLPPEATSFVNMADAAYRSGKAITNSWLKPFSFELELPSPPAQG